MNKIPISYHTKLQKAHVVIFGTGIVEKSHILRTIYIIVKNISSIYKKGLSGAFTAKHVGLIVLKYMAQGQII